MTTVYVLSLENNKFYVGKTKNLEKRIREHFDGNGSSWTKMYKPIRLINKFENVDDFEEDKQTKIYMSIHGIDNVRGGSYTKIKLDDSQISALNAEICTSGDRCFRCLQRGHFSGECPNRDEYKSYYFPASCRGPLADIKTEIKCFKCNQTGHISTNCDVKNVKINDRISQSVIRSNNVCHRFIEGKCTYGDTCKFLHDYTTEYVLNNICNDYQEDRCNRKNCYFVHVKSENIKKRQLDRHQVQPNKIRCIESSNTRNEIESKRESVETYNKLKRIRINDIFCMVDDGVTIRSLIPSSIDSILLKSPYFPHNWNNFSQIKNDLSKYGVNIKYVEKVFNGYSLTISINQNQSAIYEYVDILSKLGICNKHRNINCGDISCCFSLQINKFKAKIVRDNDINEVKIHTGRINHEQIINDLNGSVFAIESWRKITDTCIGVSFQNMHECITNLLYNKTNLPNGVTIELDFPVTIPYLEEKYNNFPITIEEYLKIVLDKNSCPKILFEGSDIVINSDKLENKLKARKELSKYYNDYYVNVESSLLIPFEKKITDDDYYSCDELNNIAIRTFERPPDFFRIKLSKYGGKIIISGMPLDKEKAKMTILYYFSMPGNRLLEEIIQLHNYERKYWKNIKKYIVSDQETLTTLGISAHVLDDSICIRGQEKYVTKACSIIKDAIESIVNYNCNNINDLILSDNDECKLCSCEVENRIVLKTCKCTFCLTCFKHMVINTYSSSNVTCIQCIGCNTPIKLSDLEIFTKDELDRIYAAAFENYMSKHWNEYNRCLTPDCHGVYHKNSQNILYCKICSSIWCLICEKSYFGKHCSHDNLTCEQFRIANSDDIQTINWINENTKPCPNCNVRIQKNEGCLHMICYRCKHHFCWKCSNSWANNHTSYYSCNR